VTDRRVKKGLPVLRFVYFGMLALVAAAVTAGCSEGESARAPAARPADMQAVTVTAAPVRAGSAQRTVDVVATLFGDEETTISAKVSGRIVAIYHDVGDRVQPGQPLAQLETRDYELTRSQRQLAMREALARIGLGALPEGDFDPSEIPTVQKARLAAENAEGRFQRGKQLHEQQPPRLSDQEFADLQTAWEIARNELQVQVLATQATLAEARARQAETQVAEQQLADATVRAPAANLAPPAGAVASAADVAGPSGTNHREYAVAQRLVSIGEFVREGTPLFRLIDDNPIKLRAAVPERFASDVRVGQRVLATVDAFEQPFVGTISRINPQVDSASRSFGIEARIENPDTVLKPGGFARASIETSREENVIFIPASAVVSFAGVNRVYVVEEGKASERLVELGPRRGDEIEIRSGLSAGDTLVTSRPGSLVTGTPLDLQP
jgi:multidrug efflux pump subunit AcrA (membrane-fusion protein)